MRHSIIKKQNTEKGINNAPSTLLLLHHSTIQARKVPGGATHGQQQQQQEGTGNLRLEQGVLPLSTTVTARAGTRGGLCWRQWQEKRLPL